MSSQKTRQRAWLNCALRKLSFFALAAFMFVGVGESATAQVTNAMVVRSDRGGLLGQRSQQIRQLRSTGQRVELQGTCFSACTMYLSLPNACVSPSATFGFHGPSRNGRRLPEREFEHWSEVMAKNYREPLRSWFMSQARYRISGYYQLSGAELIRMGYRRC